VGTITQEEERVTNPSNEYKRNNKLIFCVIATLALVVYFFIIKPYLYKTDYPQRLKERQEKQLEAEKKYPCTLVSEKLQQDGDYKYSIVSIKVPPQITKDMLYMTLITVLERQHTKPEYILIYSIHAYADNDSKMKKPLGTITQGTSSGKVTFEYNGETTIDDRYDVNPTKNDDKPLLTPVESEAISALRKIRGE
jgi:hypothetical protein